MKTATILQSLPSSLPWAVMFRLPAMRRFASDSVIRTMFELPQEISLEPFSHIVLTPAGRFLAPSGPGQLQPARDGTTLESVGTSLLDRYADLLARLPGDEADCLGLGTKPPWPPVALHLQARGAHGEAVALFRREPDAEHYELLRAAGVEYLGGEAVAGGFAARFRNDLAAHLHAAYLSAYSRTGHCNEFFLQHGEIDRTLEVGLLQAAEARTRAALNRVSAAATLLARRACRESLPMICQPPAPAIPYPFGDLVPCGFLLRMFASLPAGPLTQTGKRLEERLCQARQGKLWSFHTGRLVTSTDSALILQGLEERESVEELERFGDGSGGYYPQLWADTPQPGRMLVAHDNRHWCQADFATTCLVRALRSRMGLPERTPDDWIEHRFDRRAGLFFANPYLVDWALAQAIASGAGTDRLRRHLIADIAASRNDDFSFGQFDPALSTAFAILALSAAGSRGRLVRMAQLRLLEFIEAEGRMPRCTPFYSSLLSEREIGENPQIVDVAGHAHELSLYHDSYQVIGTAAAAMALSVQCDPGRRDVERPPDPVPDRYACPDLPSYVSRFALPPYMAGGPAR